MSSSASLTRGGAAYQSWNLDSQGNWSSSTTSGTTQTRTTDAQNQITSITGMAGTPQYDANGNMITDQNGNTLKYDAWNRLVSVTNAAGQLIASYTYNAISQRVTETYPVAAPGIPANTTKNLYYSTGGQVLEERWNGTASSDTQYQYVWSATYVNAMVLRDTFTAGTIQPDLRVYTTYDANYNVTALITYDAATQTWGVSERFVYSPYGSVEIFDANFNAITDALNWQYMYQGGRFDAATGLYHFGARNYSPSLGTWTSQDPAGYVNGANTYQMEASSPTGLVDPLGLAGTLAPGGMSVSLAEAFTYQQVNVVKKKISQLVDKLKQTVSLQINYQTDKEATIWVKVSGTSGGAGIASLESVSNVSFTGGWKITRKDGSSVTGTAGLTPGIGGAAPSASASLNFAPGSGGGFGGGANVNFGSAGASFGGSQSYTDIIAGIKTQVSVKESYGANGVVGLMPSVAGSYPIPGTGVAIGAGAGALFSTASSPLYSYGAFAKYKFNGGFGLKATFCQNTRGASGASIGPDWSPFGPNNLHVGAQYFQNFSGSASGPALGVPGVGNIPSGQQGVVVSVSAGF